MGVDIAAGYSAFAHMDDAIGDVGESGVVGDKHHRLAGSAARVLQKLQDSLAGFVIQGAGRLVAQQQLRVLGKRTGDGDALLLAAGKLRREVCLLYTSPSPRDS